MWKKICAVAASILAIVVAYFIGRSLPNRRRVSRVDDNLHDFGEHVSHTELGISDASDAVGDGRDTAGRIAELNRDAKADVQRAKGILARAKARSNQDGGNRKPD
jgi:hypothetical protein